MYKKKKPQLNKQKSTDNYCVSHEQLQRSLCFPLHESRKQTHRLLYFLIPHYLLSHCRGEMCKPVVIMYESVTHYFMYYVYVPRKTYFNYVNQPQCKPMVSDPDIFYSGGM